MAENSKIEWTHHTFNPWEGCQKVGPGCDNCYAEARDVRFTGGTHWGPGAPRRRTSAANWNKPRAWDKAAAAAGERHRVFCASLADVFDNAVDPAWRAELFHLIAQTPNLDWMLLTKRPGNIASMMPNYLHTDRVWPNVWLGCTIVNQAEADRDIPKLLAAPAKVRFLSMEPLLGRVDLTSLPYGEPLGNAPTFQDALRAKLWMPAGSWSGRGYTDGDRTYVDLCTGVDLVIVGGESGPNARPMHPDWAMSLRDQCVAAGVAFHFKQWGEWHSGAGWDDDLDGHSFGCFDDAGRWVHPVDQEWAGAGRQIMFRVGKKAAGRTLDGRTWDQMPGVHHG